MCTNSDRKSSNIEKFEHFLRLKMWECNAICYKIEIKK